MSNESSPESGINELRTLLLAWIDTETWEASQEFFAAQREQLMSDEVLYELEKMLAEAAESEEDRHELRTLRRHHRLLETAHVSSPDDAYAQILHPVLPDIQSPEAAYRETVHISQLELLLLNLPIELRQTLRAFMQVSDSKELQDLLASEPILLEQETLTIIHTLIEQLQETGEEKWVRFVGERYATLRQIAEEIHNSLIRLVRILLAADSPAKLHRVTAQYPALLEEEMLERLLEFANQTEQAGNLFMAPRLRLCRRGTAFSRAA
jgi:hypothetical protein